MQCKRLQARFSEMQSDSTSCHVYEQCLCQRKHYTKQQKLQCVNYDTGTISNKNTRLSEPPRSILAHLEWHLLLNWFQSFYEVNIIMPPYIYNVLHFHKTLLYNIIMQQSHFFMSSSFLNGWYSTLHVIITPRLSLIIISLAYWIRNEITI